LIRIISVRKSRELHEKNMNKNKNLTKAAKELGVYSIHEAKNPKEKRAEIDRILDTPPWRRTPNKRVKKEEPA
jgi:hypothetical protein